MNVRNHKSLKQTALLLMCGLLPAFCVAQQRSKTDAECIASTFACNSSQTRETTEVKLRKSSSDFSKGLYGEGKEAYYIFTHSASSHKGFCIVSGDERMPPVLAFSDDNDFDADSIPPNVRYWLDCYEEAYFSLEDVSALDMPRLAAVRDEGVEPLLGNNKWDQDDPYNQLCPLVANQRCVTGCVATAMAQVMNFYKYPENGMGVIDYRTETNNIPMHGDLSTYHFKWDNLLDSYSGHFSSEQANAIAELMYACGLSVRMDYCTPAQNGSGAHQFDLVTGFVDHFHYDNDAAFMYRNYCSMEDWQQILINELNDGRPVNYAGSSNNFLTGGGHSFVFDGYKVRSESAYPYYHVNWGWSGSWNGYYQIADLRPNEGGMYNGYDFNRGQQMIIGVKPDDGYDDDIFYLCTQNLHLSSATAQAGSTIQVYTASLANFSYKSFHGTLYVAICSDDGSETVLGEYKTNTLPYMQDKNNLSISVDLPADLPDGQYVVQLRSRFDGKQDYQKVYSSQYPLLTISSTGSISPVVESKAMLGSSELELVSEADTSVIALNIYELQNLLESPFIGDLKLILADKAGKQLCSFGDSIQPGELSTYEIQANPIRIHGQLTGNWPDGDYRLYVGARQINTSNFVYISYYDIANPDASYHDLSISAQIKAGRLIVKDKTYIISPTTIRHLEFFNDNDNSLEVYRLNGMKIKKLIKGVETLPNGIYVISKKNQKRKILFR